MGKHGLLTTITVTVLLATILLSNNGVLGQQSIREEWNQATSSAFTMYSNPSHGTPTSGVDGAYLRLTLNPNPPPGVGGAPAVETFARLSFGSYWTRARTANCSAQPKTGVVTGIFTYYNDGSDLNGNGVPDNSELDFEWLCARPDVVHLSIWTDYQESDPPVLRNTYRSLNIKTGEILLQCYRESFGECQALSESESKPAVVVPIPGYDPVNQFYDYGIIYGANRVQFLVLSGGVNYTLWDYEGPTARVPQSPLHFMHNVWHTNNWYPIDDVNGECVESPRSQVNVYVDQSTFTPAA